jgi:hypothetical protein
MSANSPPRNVLRKIKVPVKPLEPTWKRFGKLFLKTSSVITGALIVVFIASPWYKRYKLSRVEEYSNQILGTRYPELKDKIVDPGSKRGIK